MIGEVHKQYIVRCACGKQMRSPLAETKAQFEYDLRQEKWRKVAGFWFCGKCAIRCRDTLLDQLQQANREIMTDWKNIHVVTTSNIPERQMLGLDSLIKNVAHQYAGCTVAKIIEVDPIWLYKFLRMYNAELYLDTKNWIALLERIANRLLWRAEQSRERWRTFQDWQTTIPQGYATECCDILANGKVASWRIRNTCECGWSGYTSNYCPDCGGHRQDCMYINYK